MTSILLKDLKPGAWFTRKPNEAPKEKQVFIKEYYERSEKKYFCSRYSDINDGLFLKGSTVVYIDFYF